jgi:acid phosphatase
MKKNLLLIVGIGFFVILGAAVFWQKNNISLLSLPEKLIPSPSPLITDRFIMLADTGAASPAQFEVADTITKLCDEEKNCRAAFIAGDVIYEEGVTSVDDVQFKTKFEDVYTNVNLPFYIAYGNHDYLGCQECYLDYTQKSTKWKMPARYYRQDFGATSFWIIDTEQFDLDQQNWLKDELAQSSATWKVVTGHRPIVTNEATKVKENWNGKEELKAIICQQASLYVAGHAHILEDLGSLEGCNVQQLVVGGGGAYTREKTNYYPTLFDHAGNGFAQLTSNTTELSITFFDATGEVLFERSVLSSKNN